MITIYYIYKGKEVSNQFDNRIKALRFLYGIKKRGYTITGWICDDPYDNEYLDLRFRR